MNEARRGRGISLPAVVVIAAAGILVIGFGLARQPADPPSDLSASLGVLDEGLWSHNAVNAALFGNARLDDLNPMYVTSAPHLFYRASYAIFGVGILQTRLPSIFLGALTVALVGVLWARRDPLAGAVAAILLATTYLFLAYSRLGLLETPAAALAVAAVACLVLAVEGGSRAWAVAGGVLLAVALTSKLQIAGAVLGSLAGLGTWMLLERPRRVGRVALAAGGGLLAFSFAWSGWVLAHLDASVRAEWRQHALGIELSPGAAIGNAIAYARRSDGFGTHARPLLVAAATGLVLQIVAYAVRRERPKALQWAAAGWAAGSIGVLAAISYRPSRYAVLTLPGLALTAAGGVPALRSLTRGRSQRAALALAVAGAGIAAGMGIASWARWASDPAWTVRESATMLERITGDGAVILGGYALLPGTEAKRRVIVTLPRTGLDTRCPIERYGVDYVLLATNDRANHDFFEQHYPRLLRDENLIVGMNIRTQPLALYRVPENLSRGDGCSA